MLWQAWQLPCLDFSNFPQPVKKLKPAGRISIYLLAGNIYFGRSIKDCHACDFASDTPMLSGERCLVRTLPPQGAAFPGRESLTCQGYSFLSTSTPPTILVSLLGRPHWHWVSLLTRQTGRECRVAESDSSLIITHSEYSALFSLHTSLALTSSQPANMMQPASTFFHPAGHSAPLPQRRLKSLGSVAAMASPSCTSRQRTNISTIYHN